MTVFSFSCDVNRAQHPTRGVRADTGAKTSHWHPAWLSGRAPESTSLRHHLLWSQRCRQVHQPRQGNRFTKHSSSRAPPPQINKEQCCKAVWHFECDAPSCVKPPPSESPKAVWAGVHNVQVSVWLKASKRKHLGTSTHCNSTPKHKCCLQTLCLRLTSQMFKVCVECVLLHSLRLNQSCKITSLADLFLADRERTARTHRGVRHVPRRRSRAASHAHAQTEHAAPARGTQQRHHGAVVREGLRQRRGWYRHGSHQLRSVKRPCVVVYMWNTPSPLGSHDIVSHVPARPLHSVFLLLTNWRKGRRCKTVRPIRFQPIRLERKTLVWNDHAACSTSVHDTC